MFLLRIQILLRHLFFLKANIISCLQDNGQHFPTTNVPLVNKLKTKTKIKTEKQKEKEIEKKKFLPTIPLVMVPSEPHLASRHHDMSGQGSLNLASLIVR